VHGVAEHEDPEPLKLTACPTTGLAGENVNAATGAGDAAETAAVCAEVARADPPPFVAVTTTSILSPTSELCNV
jgi:hypothetical protein